jgi:Transcriptional regulator, AbiEi antitoxin
VAELARRSHGVVTRAELLRTGVTKAEIDGRLRTGSLIAVFRGVYRVAGRRLWRRATWRRWGGWGGALLSGLSAAWLWGLVKGHAPPPEV